MYKLIEDNYHKSDKQIIIRLCRQVIYNDCTKNCYIKGELSNWEYLPKTKSLFHSQQGSGLPIGNLTSQIFANFYMDSFDHFIKHELGVKYYGRYVDDFIIVHQDKTYLKSILPKITAILKTDLNLTIHPKKMYLQHYSKGVNFLGVMIKPNRIYIGKRTKGNFYSAIKKQSVLVKDHKPNKEELDSFLSSMNSNLGIMKHFNTYKLRKKMLWKHLSPYWWNVVYLSGGYAKFVRKTRRSTASNNV